MRSSTRYPLPATRYPPTMLLTIVTAGSRGDVQPYVALGLGLQRAGYRVRLATHETFREFVTGRGLDFEGIAGDPRAILSSAAADAWLATGRNRNMVAFARELRRLAGPLVEQSLHDYWRVCRGTDAVIFSAVALPAYDVARRLGVPAIGAFLQPLTRTRYFPTVGARPAATAGGTVDAVPAAPGALRGIVNYATHVAAEQALWQPLRSRVNRWRVETLGVGAAPFFGPYAAMRREQVPLLYGYSPRVVAKPADWGH